MPDWLTYTGLPSVSGLSPPYDEEAATAAAEAGDDPDEPAQALIPDDAPANGPGLAQHPDEHLPRGRPSDNRDALRVAVDALREQLERERGRADRLERARDAELEATAKAEAQREYERGRVDQADRAQSQLGALLDAAVNARRDVEAALATAKLDLQASGRVTAQLRRTDEARRTCGLPARLWQVLWGR
jgi:hypothetical protein